MGKDKQIEQKIDQSDGLIIDRYITVYYFPLVAIIAALPNDHDGGEEGSNI